MQGIIDFLAITFEKSLLYFQKRGSAIACKRLPPPLEQNWGEKRLSSRFGLRGGVAVHRLARTFVLNWVPSPSLTCLFGTWREHLTPWYLARTQTSLALRHQSLACHSRVTRVSRAPLCKRRRRSIYDVRVHCTPEGLNFFSYIFAITYVVYI